MRLTQSSTRLLRTYCAYAFLFDFMLCYAIYTALFELKGLTNTEIAALIAFWSATAVVLEVPSGALSDRFDRRWLLFIAPLAKIFTFVCWGIADGNFWLYGLGFLFWSVGSALYSGTGEALLYERLDSNGEATQFDIALGRASAAESLGIGTATLLGGFVAASNMTLSVWLSIPPLLLAALVALFMHDVRRSGAAATHAGHENEGTNNRDAENKVVAEADQAMTYVGHLREALKEFRRSADLRAITLYISAGLILFDVLEEFDQLYYLAVQLPVWLFGVVAAAALSCNALASVFAHRTVGRPALAWLLPLLGGALLVVAGMGSAPAMVVVLELAYVVVVPVTVLAEARFQAMMDGRSRATTTSMLVVAQNIFGIVVTMLFGGLADYVGVGPAYAWMGMTMVPFALWTWRQQHLGISVIGRTG